MKRNSQLTVFAVAIAALLVFSACGGSKSDANKHDAPQAAKQVSELDSIMLFADMPGGSDIIFNYLDSMEQRKAINDIAANTLRGLANKGLGNLKSTEFYLKKVISIKPETDEDFRCYSRAAFVLCNLLTVRGDYEGVLKVGVKAIDDKKKRGEDKDMDMYSLYSSLGTAQLSLGMLEQADKSFNGSYKIIQNITSGGTPKLLQNAILMVGNNIVAYFNSKVYANAEPWAAKYDSLLNVYKQLPEAVPPFVDQCEGRLGLFYANIYQGTNRPAEAAQAYDRYLKTAYAQSFMGQVDACSFLNMAGRYNEASDNFAHLDLCLKMFGIEMSLDNIREFLGQKFEANYKAGRKDSTIAVAKQIVDDLDSAIVKQKRSDVAELATLYDMQGKEMEIARQQTELSQQRFLGLAIATLLIIVGFIIFSIMRRRAAKRLAEMKAAQERIESELRIARDIQMSMVPSHFPKREGLDMYATMTPAKEVGGDMYGYVLNDDKLYVAIGDVSGKGVPASLFMAQATQLFRTLASQGMMPAEICKRMNDSLSGENNANGMFVTFWLALIDLSTGHLSFCNAGHNPPVIGGDSDHGNFLKMEANAPLGLWSGLDYIGEELKTIKGKPLFLYTDGLNEAENENKDQFGEERLLSILRKTDFENTQQVIESLTASIEQHRNGAEPNDDMTMMCLRVD